MSYDLMVFEPTAAPTGRVDFMAWYRRQIAWTEPHGYNDPAVTTPRLRAWYDAIVATYPNLSGPAADDDDRAGSMADYSIGQSIIYVAFAWPEAEEAREACRRLALKHRVGFFDASADDGEILFPPVVAVRRGELGRRILGRVGQWVGMSVPQANRVADGADAAMSGAIRTTSELAAALTSLGWTLWRDEVGDRWADKRLGAGVLTGGPSLRRAGDEFRFEFSGSITTDAVSAAYTMLRSPKKLYADDCPIERLRQPLDLRKRVMTEADVRGLSDRLIAWAEGCNVEAGLARLRALPTSSPGALPAWHLAALAVAGDVATLAGYHDAFARGDRLGFVPYITEDYIARALDFAERRAVDPNWLPKRPRMRV